MATLDCENLSFLFNSLSETFGLDVIFIKDFLKKVDEKRWEESSYPYFEDYLMEEICKISTRDVSLDKIWWFHLTRTWEDNGFEQGILPLQSIIDYIWDRLYFLVNQRLSKKKWTAFRNDLDSGRNTNHFADLYRMKLGKNFMGGPYGMLIRDVAFIPKSLSNHDYLNVPEIVDDICQCFKPIFQINLLEKFIAHTTPCIVKFFENCGDIKNIGTALHFAHSVLNKKPLSFMCNNCFDGKGNQIPLSNIEKIEFIDNSILSTSKIVSYAKKHCYRFTTF